MADKVKSYKGMNIVCDVPTSIIEVIAKAAAVSNTEVVLQFNKDGMIASSVDVTNAMAFRMDIYTSLYSYDTGKDGAEICVGVDELMDVSKTKVKDGISTITVKSGIARIETHGVKIKLPLYTDYRPLPGNVDEVIDMLPDHVNMLSSTFGRFVAVAKKYKDGTVNMLVKDGRFIVSISEEGNVDDPDVELVVPESDVTVDPGCVDVLAMFTSSYIFDIIEVLSKVSKRIRIRMGRDMPCSFGTKLQDYEILYVVAPRVEKAGEDE